MVIKYKPTALVIAALLLSACAHVSEPSPPRSGFVDVPGGPVWYEVMGDGEGTPLLTLHGGPGGTSCGLQVLARPVIRYDQLGSGRSGRPTDTSLWNPDRFVEELDELRETLGLKVLHLHGHSWGGTLAAYYVLEEGGEGITSLTLSSPLISTLKWIEDANFLRAELPLNVQATLDAHEQAGTTDSEAYQAATEIFYDKHVSRGEAVESYKCPDAPWNSAIYNKMWGPTEFYAPGSLRDFDLSPRLGEIDVPTLFITGEFDEARPETVATFANAVRGAQLRVIPGVGHASSSRAPEAYRKILRDFMRASEATP